MSYIDKYNKFLIKTDEELKEKEEFIKKIDEVFKDTVLNHGKFVEKNLFKIYSWSGYSDSILIHKERKTCKKIKEIFEEQNKIKPNSWPPVKTCNVFFEEPMHGHDDSIPSQLQFDIIFDLSKLKI